MHGHLQIIEARKKRLKPQAIFFEFGRTQLPEVYPFQKAENALAMGGYPVVTITPDETTKKHDLRFVVGCRVHVHGLKWTDEIFAFADQVVKAGAAHVIVCCALENDDLMEWKNGEWIANATEHISA